MIQLRTISADSEEIHKLLMLSKTVSGDLPGLNADENKWVLKQRNDLKKELITLERYPTGISLLFIDQESEANKRYESCRKHGFSLGQYLNKNGFSQVEIIPLDGLETESMAVAEGMALGNYQFLKYRKDQKEKQNCLSEIHLISNAIDKKLVEELNITIEANHWARDLVNEPLNKLSATDLAAQISEKVRAVGAKAEVFNKQKIEALKMGGLLSVNKGSIDPPTFTIMEWKPDNAVNKKPVILVGKGVVYDTGGLSLKPSNAMDTMKCDMAGAAVVSASLFALAKAKIPLHVMALVPATDNRPDGNAYVPGDVITMFDGTTVEVLNTDAEGRLILADALSYAKKFEPELVLNFATLTGSASRAIGSQGIVAMEVKATDLYCKLAESGDAVNERLVKFPMWDEYREQLNSEIADLKNIGGPEAGAITAGKFLEHFTDYPFVHFDIAGPAYIEKRDNYRGIGGTGIGVRLMFNFLKNYGV